MVNSLLNLSATSRDLVFQQTDTRFEFGDREGIEILPGQLHREVVGTTRKIFIGVHATKR
ncbi:hypothetical protein ATB93_04725 [Sphingomonas sp. WG]|nr:hypothetical protein ATB93_04725 [Sphingomonas sp. WG]